MQQGHIRCSWIYSLMHSPLHLLLFELKRFRSICQVKLPCICLENVILLFNTSTHVILFVVLWSSWLEGWGVHSLYHQNAWIRNRCLGGNGWEILNLIFVSRSSWKIGICFLWVLGVFLQPLWLQGDKDMLLYYFGVYQCNLRVVSAKKLILTEISQWNKDLLERIPWYWGHIPRIMWIHMALKWRFVFPWK